MLNKERKLVYKGAMDDDIEPAKVKVNYVEHAVQATLAGKEPEVKETRPRGCGVDYDD